MTSEITLFIRERVVEDFLARRISQGYYTSMLEIIKVHDELWPVMIQKMPELQKIETVTDFNTVSYQLRQNIEWHTRDSYKRLFGMDAPTNPIVLSFARIWKHHADFKPEWA